MDEIIVRFETAVCDLIESQTVGTTGRRYLLRKARQLLALNQQCVIELGESFRNPPLNILLEIFISASDGRAAPVKNICLGACASQSTALRWLDRLEDAGLIVRRKDYSDARRVLLELTDRGNHTLARLLTAG